MATATAKKPKAKKAAPRTAKAAHATAASEVSKTRIIGESVPVKLEDIEIHGGTQMRVELDQDVIKEYQLAIDKLPPVVIFADGTKKYLADGFHRFYAYTNAGKRTIPAEVRQGTQRDAILYAVHANAQHGLRRSNADKRQAVLALMNDDQWKSKPVAWIADATATTRQFVNEVKNELLGKPTRKARAASKKASAAGKEKTAAATSSPSPDAPAAAKGSDSSTAESTTPLLAETDMLGNPLQRKDNRAVFGGAVVFAQLKAEAVQLRKAIIAERAKPHGAMISDEAVGDAFQNVYNAIEFARPYCECPLCISRLKPDCRACRGNGWLTKDQWSALPEEIRPKEAKK